MSALLNKKRARKEVDLDAMVASGAEGAYEALQLYRSRSMRHKQKDDIIGAITEAAHGARCLFANGYINAGSELASLVVDIINESGIEINPQVRQVVFELDSAFPSEDASRVEFLKACVKATINNGQRELGEPSMHLRLANCLWEMKSKNAIYHYVLSEDPETLAMKIDQRYGTAKTIVERDQALTLSVLHFLALENLRDANELFKNFKKSQKSKNLPMDSHLVVFCDYLLQTCRRDAVPLFKTLVNTYAPMLDFDEVAPTLLMGPISQRLFGIQSKVNPVMSVLSTLLN